MTKIELLAKYAEKNPTIFRQIDDFKCDGWDEMIRPNEDGIGVIGGTTTELMTTEPCVRMLIPRDADRDYVIRSLEATLDWLKEDGLTRCDECSSEGATAHADATRSLRLAVGLLNKQYRDKDEFDHVF